MFAMTFTSLSALRKAFFNRCAICDATDSETGPAELLLSNGARVGAKICNSHKWYEGHSYQGGLKVEAIIRKGVTLEEIRPGCYLSRRETKPMPNAAPTSQEEHQEPETKPETVSTGVLRITVPNGLRTLTVAKVLTLDLKPSTRNALQGCEGDMLSVLPTLTRKRQQDIKRAFLFHASLGN
jgi:hypothetical protein